MQSKPPDLTAKKVLAFLENLNSAQANDALPPEWRRSYREAAAVLASIVHPDQLRPLGTPPLGKNAERLLGADLIPMSGSKFRNRMMLEPGIRRATLKELAASGRIKDALALNPSERTGPLQERLEQYLLNGAPPLEEQTLAELEETYQVMLWLGDAIGGTPPKEEVRNRIAFLRLLAPFEAIASDRIFRGRRRELDKLRSYIGVIPPESLLRRLQDLAFKWAEPKQQPAISISGPAGVGKSALIARFMLEHTRLPENVRIPFAYLDFDRPALDVGDPMGLCVEMIRQLDVQFNEKNRFNQLRSSADNNSLTAISYSSGGQISSAYRLLADLLGLIRSELGPRPYIVVLDTFEEVQYRGETRANPLWEMLAELQQQARFLRVVVSGRASVTSLRLARKNPHQIALTGLDTDAALAFLDLQGVKDLRLAEQLVRAFGTVPLSLKLAASLTARQKEVFTGLSNKGRFGGVLTSVADEVIQGQLYDRILSHIKDERVRRVAYPGLVLRRINAEIILWVLNEPCDLGVRTLDQAQELFNEIRREAALVTTDDEDGDLVHRADLRRVMLKLLIQAEPVRVEKIRRAAVEWYSAQSGRRARAEEIYHRLHLGERIKAESLLDNEVRASIQAVVVEFSVATQLQLAELGFDVPNATVDQASQEQKDSSKAAKIEKLLSYGKLAEKEAAQLISRLTKKLDRPSVLFRAAARVAAQQDDSERASKWIECGLEQSVPAGLTKLTLDLLREQAWLQRKNRGEQLHATLLHLAEYGTRHQDRVALLQHHLQCLAMDIEDDDSSATAVIEILSKVGPGDVWGLAPAFLPIVSLRTGHGSEEILDALHRHVLAGNSPFRLAVFPVPKVRKALDTMLLAASSYGISGFRRAFQDLCEMWPYRVLFVQPPYGSRGEKLSESKA